MGKCWASAGQVVCVFLGQEYQSDRQSWRGISKRNLGKGSWKGGSFSALPGPHTLSLSSSISLVTASIMLGRYMYFCTVPTHDANAPHHEHHHHRRHHDHELGRQSSPPALLCCVSCLLPARQGIFKRSADNRRRPPKTITGDETRRARPGRIYLEGKVGHEGEMLSSS